MICQMSLNIMPIYGYECLPASARPSLMIVGQLDRLRGEKIVQLSILRIVGQECGPGLILHYASPL